MNFIKYKREYVVILIIPIGHTFTFKIKQSTYHSTGKNITGKIFNQKRIQKEKYEMKGKIKIINNNNNKNKRVIYEALANKLRSSLQWRRHYIIYIGFIYIDIN